MGFRQGRRASRIPAITQAAAPRPLGGCADLGLLSVSAIVERLASMADVVPRRSLPTPTPAMASAQRQAAARAFERAGVAAFHLEDQTFPRSAVITTTRASYGAGDGAEAQSRTRRLA